MVSNRSVMGAGYFFISAMISSVVIGWDFLRLLATADSKNADTSKFTGIAPHIGRYENNTHGRPPKNNKNKMQPIIIQTPKKGSPRHG